MSGHPPDPAPPAGPAPDEPQGSWARRPAQPDHPGRWNPLTHQPYSGTSHFQRLWMSRGDMLDILHMIGRNLRHAWPAYRAYHEQRRREDPPQRIEAHQFGLGVTPTAANLDRLEESTEELGVRSLLIRVPSWNPAPVLALQPRLEALRRRGYRFLFGLVQDRRATIEPAAWGRFVADAAAAFDGLEPTFQLGQAVNRKKWGVWHPDEYLRMMEAVAHVRERFPRARWLGPPVIDFEYHVTMYYLFAPRPFDFDGISSLLYVDRRGSPHGRQYGHFDLRRKIVLLRAIVETSPHPNVPLHLTEFNWPLRGAAEHAPAGRAVQTDEERQAIYLVVYYLTALSVAGVAGATWWQLVARGYGLCEDDDAWTRRPSFEALRTLIRRAAGTTVARLARTLAGVRGFVLQAGDRVTLVLYADSAPARVTLPRPPDDACDLRGGALRLTGAAIEVGRAPVFLAFAGERADDLVAACGLATAGSPAAR